MNDQVTIDKNPTPAQRKLTAYLQKRYPNLTKKEMATLLLDVKRFVYVVRKIYKEPQAVVTYEDGIVDGKKEKIRVFTTDLEEWVKLKGDDNRILTGKDVKRLHENLTKKDL